MTERLPFCTRCGVRQLFNLQTRQREATVRGLTFDFPEVVAHCSVYDTHLYIPIINDLNVFSRQVMFDFCKNIGGNIKPERDGED